MGKTGLHFDGNSAPVISRADPFDAQDFQQAPPLQPQRMNMPISECRCWDSTL
jgi:hypothetical protein